MTARIENDFPSDNLFRRLHMRFYAGEAAMVLSGAVGAVATSEMFRSVWDHNVPKAIATGGLALAGVAIYRVGQRKTRQGIVDLAIASMDMGEAVAEKSNTEIQHIAMTFGADRPSATLMMALTSRAYNACRKLAIQSTLFAPILEIDFQSGNRMAAAICTAAFMAGSTFIDHRRARRATNDLMRVGLNTGFCKGVERKDMLTAIGNIPPSGVFILNH